MIKNNASAKDNETEEKKPPAKKEKSTRQSQKAILEAKYEELNDKYLRTLAEYDNYKKRTAKEKDAIFLSSVGDTVTKLLPLLDNLERAMATFGENDKESEFYKGFQMIFTQAKDTFSSLGVSPIEAVGSQFNPELHNAVMHIDDESYGENIIVEEFQKGYTYKDKVIRYSMVKVAN